MLSMLSDTDKAVVETITRGMHVEPALEYLKDEGQQDSHYFRDIPRTVYTIPFSKKAVDDVLENKLPFGPDPLNVTPDKESIVYHGKFNQILGMESFRCADSAYEQFTLPEWKEFVALAIQEGGPQRRVRFPDEELKRMGLYR